MFEMYFSTMSVRIGQSLEEYDPHFSSSDL